MLGRERHRLARAGQAGRPRDLAHRRARARRRRRPGRRARPLRARTASTGCSSAATRSCAAAGSSRADEAEIAREHRAPGRDGSAGVESDRDRLDPRARHRARRARPPASASSSGGASELVGSGETDADGRIRELADAGAGHLPDRLPPALAVLPPGRARGRARRGPLPHPAARLLVRVRDLPRQLSVEELAGLFEGRTRFVERLAAARRPARPRPRGRRDASPTTRRRRCSTPTRRSARRRSRPARAAEQGTDEAPELDELNRRYEERFGFRFVVFVNRRPKSEIVPILRERLERTREQELATALDELVSIAEDRWRRS